MFIFSIGEGGMEMEIGNKNLYGMEHRRNGEHCGICPEAGKVGFGD